MRLIIIPSIVLIGLFSTNRSPAQSPPPAPKWPEDEVEKLLDRIDQLWRGQSSEATLTMSVKTEQYSRTMTMKTWSLGQDFFLVRILLPKKDRGTATLKRDDQIYNYLPKVNRTIKIGAAMMGGSWMGSHFTNDDLVQESRLAADYRASVREVGDDRLEVELIPKKNSAVVWGKVELTVKKPELYPIEQTFYDEDLKPVRRMEFSDVTTLAGRTLPRRFKVIPLDKPSEYTEMVYDELKFDTGVKADFFSLGQLERLP